MDTRGHQWTLLVALLLLLAGARAEVYTSTAQLEQVFRVEKEVVSILNEYIAITQLKLMQMQNYVDAYHRISNEDNELDSVDNPLKAFQLVKRLAIDWQMIETEMRNHDWNTVLSVIREKRSVAAMPQEADLQGAAFALIRLKHTYQLKVSDLSKGVIQGLSTRGQLNARDCLYLGRNTLHVNLGSQLSSSAEAIEWLEEAMMIANVEKNATAGQQEIRPFLQEAIHMHDSHLHLEQPLQQESSSIGLEDIRSSHKERTKANVAVNDVDRFDALCRGEKLRAAAYEAQLKCYFRNGPHPYLLLNRLKVELNNLHPPLFTLHDVIYDQEIQLIKSIAKPHLQRSTVVGNGEGNWRMVSDTRTSQNTWLYMETVQEHQLLLKLYKRLDIITGLKAGDDSAAESLQVANYGVGGHYVPHYDFLFQTTPLTQMANADPEDLMKGDRMATLMFYLSDVARGGATAFPKLGTAIWPKKGSAAFWFNLKQNGQGDLLTLHGACPVLHGSKWVANKWIRERSQMQNRPCSLDKNQ